MAVSAAINGGILYQPYIVKSLNEPVTNSVIQENKPKIVRKVISDETSELVRSALESVVSLGTGRPAFIKDYRVGGKTGTAQKVKDGRYMVGNYVVSFIGFLPADDPEVVVYIAVDNAKGVTQYGGTIAGPIARNVMLDAIDILQIPPRENEQPKEYNYLDRKFAEVPDIVGMEVKEAIKLLKSFKVEFSGSGDIVSYQSPSAGTTIYEGDVVRLFVRNG